jgi:general secretion pathway protein C
MRRLPLMADIILSGTLCASLAYWGMHFLQPGPRHASAFGQQVEAAMPNTDAAAVLFGGQAPGAAAARTFVLTGVIADGPNGVAILAMDGKPPQVVGPGTEAAPGVMVTEVNAVYVLLSEDGMIKRIDLPESVAKGGLKIADRVLAVQSPLPVTIVNSKPEPSPHKPVRNPTNGLAPGTPPQMMIVNNGEVPSQELRFIRPSGMGPGARGAKMTPLPMPAMPAVQQ